MGLEPFLYKNLYLYFYKLPITHITPLIRESNNETVEKVIESVKISLESGKHPLTGVFIKKRNCSIFFIFVNYYIFIILLI